MASQKLNIDIVARDRSRQALSSLQTSLGKLKESIFNIRNAFLGLGAGLVIRNLTNTGKQLESLNVRLKFLFGSAKEGAKAFDNMAKFASRVPFSLEEIQQGAGVLSVVSKDADELAHILEITGNVAAVTGLDFRTTAEQIQRSLSAGISSADLFRERGVKAMLGFSAGATVSVEQTVEAFERVFGKEGRFGRATDDLAQTFEGTLSMIGDKIFVFKKTILEAGFFEGLKTEFGELDKFLQENANQIESIGRKIGVTLAAAVTKLSDGIKLVKNNFETFLTAVKALIALKIVIFFGQVAVALMNVAKATAAIAIGASAIKKGFLGILGLVGTGGALFLAMKGLDELFQGFLEKVDNLEKKLYAVKHPLGEIHEGLGEISKAFENSSIIAHEFEHELSVAIPSATDKAIDKFRELNDGALENIRSKFTDIRTTIVEGLNSGITQFSNALARAIVMGEDLGKSFKRMVQEALTNTLALLIEILLRMGIQKLLGIELKKGEDGRLQTAKKYTSELKKQVALAAILAVLTGGGSMAGGGGFFGFGKASGGAVAKGQPELVGERGPELFVPNSTGQITQNARGTGSGAVTVNFNINTVDATGFDELLVSRRGTITQIINSAVNEQGRKDIV